MKEVVLKETGQGSGEFLQAVYADEEEEGAVMPKQSLEFLYRGDRPSVMAATGGSEGTWVVRIENTGESRPVVDANLVLCQIETGQDSLVSDAVQAFVGSIQPTLPVGAPWTVDGEVLSEEDMAAMRRTAALALINMKDEEGNSVVRGLFDNLKEGSKARLEILQSRFNDTNSESKWKPGQLASSAIETIGNAVGNLLDGEGLGLLDSGHLGGSLLDGALLAGGVLGDNPDKVVWSRLGLPNLDSLPSLPKIDEEALQGLSDKVRGLGAELNQKIQDWKPNKIKESLESRDGLPLLPTLGQLPPLSLPPLSLPELPKLNSGNLPTFDDVRSSLDSIASKLSANAQNWAEKRADQRESFMSGIESSLEGAKSKLEAGMGSLRSLELPKPDLSGVKDRLSDVISQVKEGRQRLEKPREEFKSMLSTAVEKTVKQQVEAVAGQFDLDAVEQRLVDAGVDTDELLDSLSGADLDKLLDRGVGINFRDGLSLDGALGEHIVAQLLGIDNEEEAHALFQGLKDAGFLDLATEMFLTPDRR